ncbi:MAG TPA: exosortase/archaeosortase family protein [Candidatus Thermoplasmatota archaeon]|nr:exosortase/archaeosortase family protein [Candidatus Thermoplasmatota archaeon]
MNPTLARIMSLLGLASLGEGLFILFRVVPHESPLLGAGLAALGALLLFFARPARIERLPRAAVGLAGAAIAGAVLAFNLLRHSTFAPPEIALVGLGLLLVALAPFVDRAGVATPVAWALPVAGAPLAVWAAQAFTKTSFGGATPLELFIVYGLVTPMALILDGIGFPSTVHGQVIVFPTARGSMSLNVGAACSGLQAMGLFSGILLMFIVTEKPDWRRGAFWCAIGLFGVYAINVIRLVVLALVGYQWGSAALQWTHANAGWAFFVAWTGIFAWLAMGRKPKRAPIPA